MVTVERQRLTEQTNDDQNEKVRCLTPEFFLLHCPGAGAFDTTQTFTMWRPACATVISVAGLSVKRISRTSLRDESERPDNEPSRRLRHNVAAARCLRDTLKLLQPDTHGAKVGGSLKSNARNPVHCFILRYE